MKDIESGQKSLMRLRSRLGSVFIGIQLSRIVNKNDDLSEGKHEIN